MVQRVVSPDRPRLLVVGGNGFIGRRIVNHALGIGWSITSLSLSLPVVGDWIDRVVYLAADIANCDELKKALPEPCFEYVVNCGGYINHALFLNGGRKVLDVHFSGVPNLTQLLSRDALVTYANITGCFGSYLWVNSSFACWHHCFCLASLFGA